MKITLDSMTSCNLAHAINIKQSRLIYTQWPLPPLTYPTQLKLMFSQFMLHQVSDTHCSHAHAFNLFLWFQVPVHQLLHYYLFCTQCRTHLSIVGMCMLRKLCSITHHIMYTSTLAHANTHTHRYNFFRYSNMASESYKRVN